MRIERGLPLMEKIIVVFLLVFFYGVAYGGVREPLEIVEKRIGEKEISLYIGEKDGWEGYFLVVRRKVEEDKYKNSGLFIPFGSEVGYDMKSGKEIPLSPAIKDFVKEHTDPGKISKAKEIASQILEEEKGFMSKGGSDLYDYMTKQSQLIYSFRTIDADYKLDGFLYWVWKEKYQSNIDIGLKEKIQKLYEITPQNIDFERANLLVEDVRRVLNEHLKQSGVEINKISVLYSDEVDVILGFAVRFIEISSSGEKRIKNVLIVVPKGVDKIDKDVFYQMVLHEAGHFVYWNNRFKFHHLAEKYLTPDWAQKISDAFSGLDERLADSFARETLPMLNNKAFTQKTNCGNMNGYPDIIERVYLQKGEGKKLIEDVCIEEVMPHFWQVFTQ